MSKRLSPIEKLARDICWDGFSTKPKDTTRAAYWASLPKFTSEQYLTQAAELIWWARRLGIERIATALRDHDAPSPVTQNQSDPLK